MIGAWVRQFGHKACGLSSEPMMPALVYHGRIGDAHALRAGRGGQMNRIAGGRAMLQRCMHMSRQHVDHRVRRTWRPANCSVGAAAARRNRFRLLVCAVSLHVETNSWPPHVRSRSPRGRQRASAPHGARTPKPGRSCFGALGIGSTCAETHSDARLRPPSKKSNTDHHRHLLSCVCVCISSARSLRPLVCAARRCHRSLSVRPLWPIVDECARCALPLRCVFSPAAAAAHSQLAAKRRPQDGMPREWPTEVAR